MKLIAYDPSVQATGMASLEDGQVTLAWTIKPKTEGTDRYAEIGKQVAYDLIELFGEKPEDDKLPDHAVIEIPDKWTRAGKNVEDIQKLCTVAGVIIGVCTAFGLSVRLYTPKQWKGRKSKKITQNELGFQGYDMEELGWDDHACDAAALALWAAGQIRPEYLMQVDEHLGRVKKS